MDRRKFRVGFDIGGTFTDFALYDTADRKLQIHKALTTPENPSKGAIEGIRTLLELSRLDFRDIDEIVHGTTLVTNALIEKKGAKTGLLTTRGFRDVMETGREQRYDIYDLFLKYPDALVPRRFRREVSERILASGEIYEPLLLDDVRREARFLLAEGVRSVAICFLHSYRNPDHEAAAWQLLAAEFPQLSVSLSSEVAPEIGEYERVCTTAANAFVRPLMDSYIEILEGKLAEKGFRGQLFLMLSSGGLATPDVARRFPIRMLESGPAGGALATSLVSRKLNCPDLISFDMGGTTAKTAMVKDHVVPVAPMMEVARAHRFKKGSGIPVRSPVVEMIEIGAGGGSIAHLDEVKLLKVGPESASSNPGPACYGLGGTQPTVTDANLILGYLDPDRFLGGRMRLDTLAAERALASVGREIGLDAIRTAWGVYSIVCENMAAAARAHIIERGCDPRAFSMVAFGGAGPAHAARVARLLGVREVIVPPASGAASAVGFLAAPASFETVRSAVFAVDEMLDLAAVSALLDDIEEVSRAHLADAYVDRDSEFVSRVADMRLKGQLHEISVDLPDGPLTETSIEDIRQRFVRTYERIFQAVPPNAAIEALSWRVRVSGPVPDIEIQPRTDDGEVHAEPSTRPIFIEDALIEAQVYSRYALQPGDEIKGPAIVQEHESTTVIPTGDVLTVDQDLNLRIAIANKALPTDAAPHRQLQAEAIEADPIGLEIMWGRMANIIDETWDTVCRTAFSLIISDAQDFSVALFDNEGEILVHSPRAQPVFNLSLPLAIKSVVARFRGDRLEPGDILVTNDPWLASGHLYDVAIVTPVFHEGRVVAHVGAIGHVSDIGGTKRMSEAHEVYEEGLQIPPMKLYKRGAPNEDLFALLRENVRDADMVVADLQALSSASGVAARRLQDFLGEYGFDTLSPLAEIFHRRSEAAMRNAIKAVPDGSYTSQVSGLIGETSVTIPVEVTVEGDQICIDLSGAPAAIARGGYNCTLNYAISHSLFPLKCLLTPSVRGNSGCYRPFSVTIPEGSLLNARKPASVSTRQVTGWFLGPTIFSALAEALPHKVRAFSGMPAGATFYGTGNDDKPYIGHLIFGGGQGASASDDGKSGLLFPIGGTASSVELLELRTHVVVTEKQLDSDSGGAGRHRGGLGQVFRMMKLPGENIPLDYVPMLYGEQLVVPTMEGGEPGRLVEMSVSDAHGAVPLDGDTTAMRSIENGETLILRTAGGYGYGDPLERDLTAIGSDLLDGYVTPDQAAKAYGCILRSDGRIDAAATADRRASLRRNSPSTSADNQ
jgi:5-oxoprolinase (ATP-hydrolysing)/N-methylhydantoinase A